MVIPKVLFLSFIPEHGFEFRMASHQRPIWLRAY